VPTVRHAVLCEPHAKKFRLRRPRRSLEQFLADPRVRPFPSMPPCQVAACTRAADGACGYCNTHYQRWRTVQGANPELDQRGWQAIESGVAEPGQVNLRALSARVVVEVLFGIQQRVRGGAQIPQESLRPGTAVAAPPGSAARSTRSDCCRGISAADRTVGSIPPRWAAATSRASSIGWPTWNPATRSAATAATVSAATCGQSWLGFAPWA
jgi:hypothetical protein